MYFAILGAGKIACALAKAVNGLEDVNAYAVASRDLERAKTFADTWGFEKAYGSYEEMLADPAVDLVYVATPHSHHMEHAKLCISYGKPVLCEKAFTANAKQAEELLSFAKEKGVFITEAIWTRYMPSRRKIDEIIASGIIGEVQGLQCNLGYEMTQKGRLNDPALAGGALLDVGVYCLNFAAMVLGTDIVSTSSGVILRPTGVDAQANIFLTYRNGAGASLYTTMMSATDRVGYIYGSKGYLEVQNINNPEEIRVVDNDHRLIRKVEIPAQINGYEYEVLACRKALEEGRLECEEMPHEETLRIMRQMDELRAQWGVRYPFE